MDLQGYIESLVRDIGGSLSEQARLYAEDVAVVLTNLRSQLIAQGNDPNEVFALAKREAERIAAQRLARLAVDQREIVVARVWAGLDLALTLLTAVADGSEEEVNDGTVEA